MKDGTIICDGCKGITPHCCHGEKHIVVNDVQHNRPCECWPCLVARVILRGEVVRLLFSAPDNSFSVALAFVSFSQSHRHNVGVETYTLASGRLEVYIGESDNEHILLTKPGATVHISEGKCHWARRNGDEIAIISVVSVPSWNPTNSIYD